MPSAVEVEAVITEEALSECLDQEPSLMRSREKVAAGRRRRIGPKSLQMTREV
jgi:hypothetical protein